MRTRAQRLATANEVKLHCIEHQLSDDLGTRVLILSIAMLTPEKPM
jgi:hypothetical protein